MRPLAQVAAAFALLAATPWFLGNDYYLSVLILACINALMAMGLNVLIGYAGQISLGHAGFYGLAAYTTAILTATHGLPVIVGMAAGVALTTGVAWLIAIPTLRLTGHYLAMATLGMGVILSIVFNEAVDLTGGPSGFVGIPKLSVAGVPLDTDRSMYYVLVAVLCLAALACFRLLGSRFGRALRALHTSERAAQAAGVDVASSKRFAFVFSAALAAVAGVLYAHHLGFIAPASFGFHVSVQLVTMVVLGGMGSVWGAVFGAFFLTMLPEFLRSLEELDSLVYGAVLVVCMIYLPGGAASGARALWTKLRGRLAARRAPEVARGAAGPAVTPSGPAASQEAVPVVAGVAAGVEVAAGAVTEAGAGAEAAQDSAPLLEAKGITVRFGGVVALDEADFTVSPGSIAGLIGPNGAGKTTLLGVASGMVRPSSGSLALAGREVTDLAPHQLAQAGIVRTFQNLEIFSNMTVLENVMAGAHGRMDYGLTAALARTSACRSQERECRSQAMERLAFVGLEHAAQLPAASLPYGSQRLVELARALAAGPSLLLLDEPAAGLNNRETKALGRVIRRIRDELGITVALVEHDMDLVMEVCDHITVLCFGRVIATGTPLEVQRNPEVLAAYLGEDGDD